MLRLFIMQEEIKMKKNTKLILAVIALVVVIAVFVGVYVFTRPDTAEGAKEIVVTVVHGDGTEKEFVYHTDYEYLGEVILEDGLVEGDDSEYGLYIKVVDGEQADYTVDGAYWALWQNGEMAMQGADQTPIADGDTFSLVYTIG